MQRPGPYLEGALRGVYDVWQERALARFSPPLTFQEIRRGVQALSTLYVERRREGNLASRSLDGAGKRAAFACFYAPLHFLTLFHALRETDVGRIARVVDVGCGTAAAGAAAALAIAERSGGAAPELLGVDRSGFALGEARRTTGALGLRGSFRRGALPDALPALRGGDLVVVAWCANELPDAARDALLAALSEAAARGAGLVVAEPLATGVAPWWRAWVAAFASRGGHATEARVRLALPTYLARLDRAAGLDHRELGARVLWVPAAALRSHAMPEDDPARGRSATGRRGPEAVRDQERRRERGGARSRDGTRHGASAAARTASHTAPSLSWLSRHSSAASESATIAPPECAKARLAATCAVRITTARSAPPRTSK